jgi:hypothetical protein
MPAVIDQRVLRKEDVPEEREPESPVRLRHLLEKPSPLEPSAIVYTEAGAASPRDTAHSQGEAAETDP